MTDEVIFVKELVLERARYAGRGYMEYCTSNIVRCTDDATLETMDPVTVRHAVPIHRICHSGKPDVYVAYSEEVSGILGLPYDAMKEAMDAMNSRYNDLADRHDKATLQLRLVRGMTFMQRLKFLLTGNMGEEK